MSLINHLNYLVHLDRDLEICSRYIDFSEDNFSTYSNELAKILLAAGSEADVVFKLLCKRIDSKASLGGIGDYKSIILKSYSRFIDFKTYIPSKKMYLKPWQDWRGLDNNRLEWWDSYSKVKHARHSHMASANLKHTLLAFSGLMSLIYYCYSIDQEKNMFTIPIMTKFIHHYEEAQIGATFTELIYLPPEVDI